MGHPPRLFKVLSVLEQSVSQRVLQYALSTEDVILVRTDFIPYLIYTQQRHIPLVSFFSETRSRCVGLKQNTCNHERGKKKKNRPAGHRSSPTCNKDKTTTFTPGNPQWTCRTYVKPQTDARIIYLENANVYVVWLHEIHRGGVVNDLLQNSPQSIPCILQSVQWVCPFKNNLKYYMWQHYRMN